jgi:hypothetical protein
MLGEYPKIRTGSLNTGEENTRMFKFGTQFTKEETRNLLKTAHASKVVNPFTRALTPPFYRETKGLLHSENTLESKEYS